MLKILRKPLFAGDSEIDQLYRIFRMLGTPNDKVWPGVTQLPDFRAIFPKWDPQSLPNAIEKHPDRLLTDFFKVRNKMLSDLDAKIIRNQNLHYSHLAIDDSRSAPKNFCKDGNATCIF